MMRVQSRVTVMAVLLLVLFVSVTAQNDLSSEELMSRLEQAAKGEKADDETEGEWQAFYLKKAQEAYDAEQREMKLQLQQQEVLMEMERKRQELEGRSKETQQLFQAVIQATDDNHGELRDLLRTGVDVNRVNRNGETALHVACAKGEAGVVEFLLRAGANPNARANRAQSAEDMTPLGWCVLAGKYDATEAMLDTDKTDVNMFYVVRQMGNKRQTALDLARSRRDEDMIALLLEYKAKTYEEIEEKDAKQKEDIHVDDEEALHRFLNLEA